MRREAARYRAPVDSVRTPSPTGKAVAPVASSRIYPFSLPLLLLPVAVACIAATVAARRGAVNAEAAEASIIQNSGVLSVRSHRGHVELWLDRSINLGAHTLVVVDQHWRLFLDTEDATARTSVLGLCPGQHVAVAVSADYRATEPVTFNVTLEDTSAVPLHTDTLEETFCVNSETVETARRLNSARRPHLTLRSSLIVSGGDGGERELPLLLREGESISAVARAFVADKLGLQLPAEASAAVVVGGKTQKRVEGARADEQPLLEEPEGDLAAAAAAVRWITDFLEAEVAVQVLRRADRQTEARSAASSAGGLKIAIGEPRAQGSVSGGSGGSGGIDSSNSSSSGLAGDASWVLTGVNELDVTRQEMFEALLRGLGEAPVSAFLAEHVWEHLSLEEAYIAAANCFAFLRPGGRLRIAVPDPNYNRATASPAAEVPTPPAPPRPQLPPYLSAVALAADILHGHRVQYTLPALAAVCHAAGFEVIPREYCAEFGELQKSFRAEFGGDRESGAHAQHSSGSFSEADAAAQGAAASNSSLLALDGSMWGRVKRSSVGEWGASSIVVDCVKPAGAPNQSANVAAAAAAAAAVPSGGMAVQAGSGGMLRFRSGRGSLSALALDADGAAEWGEGGFGPPKPAKSSSRGQSDADAAQNSGIRVEIGLQTGDVGPVAVIGRAGGGGGAADGAAVSQDGDSSVTREGSADEAFVADLRGDAAATAAAAAAVASLGEAQRRSSASASPSLGLQGHQINAPATASGANAAAAASASPLLQMADAAANGSVPTVDRGVHTKQEKRGKEAISPEKEAELDGLLQRARAAVLSGDMAAALPLCEQVLAVRPNDPRAWLYMGAVSGAAGNWTAAAAHMEAALGPGSFRDPENVPEELSRDENANSAPLFLQLAAATNLGAVARAGADGNAAEDVRAELLFLMEGLQRAAEAGPAAALALATGDMPGLPEATVLLLRVAELLEEEGQLLAAVRTYQRALLLDSHLEPALQGLAALAHRISRLRSREIDPLQDVTNERHGEDFVGGKESRGSCGADSSKTACTNSKGESPAFQVLETLGQETEALPPLCRWRVARPSRGQVFAKGEVVAVEFDAALADPMGASGSVFGGQVGLLLCSHLEHGKVANCLPRPYLSDLTPGWHTLTAEGFALPAGEPLFCPQQRVRFCVEGGATNCSAAAALENDNEDVQAPTASLQMPTTSKGAAPSEVASSKAGTETTKPVRRAPPALPLCVVTIALNGMPFITHHIDVLAEAGRVLSGQAAAAAAAAASTLNFTETSENGRLLPPEAEDFWEWHVVEGAVAGGADFGRPFSGRRPLPEGSYDVTTGLSTDGTTEFMDNLAAIHPRNVFLHRLCDGRSGGGGSSGSGSGSGSTDGSCLWLDKAQMVNAGVFAASASGRECLLLQVDSDELWTAEQLVRMREMFLQQQQPALQSEESTKSGGGDSGSANNDSREPETAAVKRCAYFDCHFFVGPDLVTATPNGYGHSEDYEWLRAWVLPPLAAVFLQHAPPVLAISSADKSNRLPSNGGGVDGGTGIDEVPPWLALEGAQCFSRQETRERGLVFTHFAYVLDSQVAFKSQFYGSAAAASQPDSTAGAALSAWRAMQQLEPPVKVTEHLPWVKEAALAGDLRLLPTVADRPLRDDVMPPLSLEPFLNGKFREKVAEVAAEAVAAAGVSRVKELQARGSQSQDWPQAQECSLVHVVVDGVLFQTDKFGGFRRVWEAALPALINRLSDYNGACLTLLARGSSLETLPSAVLSAFEAGRSKRPLQFGILRVPLHTEGMGLLSDELTLTSALKRLRSRPTAFVSSEYTRPHASLTPRAVRRVLLLHDVLPERFGWDMASGVWLAKARVVADADAVVTVSQATASDFSRFYLWDGAKESSKQLLVAHNGVDTSVFRPASAEATAAFRKEHGLGTRPYVVLVGPGGGYKNAATVIRALSHARASEGAGPDLLLVSSSPPSAQMAQLLQNVRHVHLDALSDADLARAYSGALAHAHVALGEGFGLTVLEAMACGCPVVVSGIEPLREVTGALASDLEGGNAYTSSHKDVSEGRFGVDSDGGGASGSSGGVHDSSDGGGAGSGVIVVSDPLSATEVWRALRALMAASEDVREGMAERLVDRAARFGSWQPLADTLITAALAH